MPFSFSLPSDAKHADAKYGRLLLVVALALGALVRLGASVAADFPVADGGLFFLAAREIQRNGFVLPATLPYPTVTPAIPFCYPPLAFYLLAVLEKLGLSLELTMRFLPGIFATATIWAIWNLARALFADVEERDTIAGLASLFWALTPLSFLWMVMGGGITRAPGLFFALWGIERAIRLWRDNQQKALWGLLLLLALCLATHLERARFLLIAMMLVWLLYNRSWRGFLQGVACVSGAVALTSPWWGTCLARFGLAPFKASFASGGGDWMSTSLWRSGLGGEYLPGLIVFALAGFWIYRRQIPFLWLWYGVIWALEVRSGRNFISAPVALGAACSLVRLRPVALRAVLYITLVVWLMLQSTGTAVNYKFLSPATRQAMAWCAQNTPQDARFLVVTSTSSGHWWDDLEGEWFPALAHRAVPLTVQGTEWLARGTFVRQQKQHEAVLQPKGAAYIQDWPHVQRALAEIGVRCDWVFFPRAEVVAADGSKLPWKTARLRMQHQLLTDHNWRIAFQNADVLVLTRRTKR